MQKKVWQPTRTLWKVKRYLNIENKGISGVRKKFGGGNSLKMMVKKSRVFGMTAKLIFPQ